MFSVAVCLLMLLDPELDSEAAIEKLKGVRGPGAIQSVKVNRMDRVHKFNSLLDRFHEQKLGAVMMEWKKESKFYYN